MIEKLRTLRNTPLMLVTCALAMMLEMSIKLTKPSNLVETIPKASIIIGIISVPTLWSVPTALAKFKCKLNFSSWIHSKTLWPCGMVIPIGCHLLSFFLSFTTMPGWLCLILEAVLTSRLQRISTPFWVKVDD